MMALPKIMVAPNGAFLTKADHPAVPVTIQEIVDCALECRGAGAGGIHAHVRDADQKHVLDVGLYIELLGELALKTPGFYVQATTEAVGRYTPDQQRRFVEKLRPAAASVSIREMLSDKDEAKAAKFYAFCAEAEVDIQHILYDDADILHLDSLLQRRVIPDQPIKVLMVHGRYTKKTEVSTADLVAMTDLLRLHQPDADWAICAFGKDETANLAAAIAMGGKARIGFENNRLNSDQTTAASNAERVAELVMAISAKSSDAKA